MLPAPGGSRLAGSVVATDSGRRSETFEADAVIIAAGPAASKRLVEASPLLAASDDLRGIEGVRSSDVLAARLWLDTRVALRFKSNVLSGFDAGAGATLFDLSSLQVRTTVQHMSVCVWRGR